MLREENVAAVKTLFEEKHIPEDYEEARSHLRCKLISDKVYERELADLNVLHEKELGLTLIPIYDSGTGYSHAIPVEAARIWERAKDEIVQAALTETEKAYPPQMQALNDLLLIPIKDEGLYVLSAGKTLTKYEANDEEWYPFGAIVMMMSQALQMAANKLQADFYILPSLWTEVYLLPIRRNESDTLNKLHLLMHNIIAQTPSRAILTRNIYVYHRGMGLTLL